MSILTIGQTHTVTSDVLKSPGFSSGLRSDPRYTDFRFSRSSDMTGARKIFNGSHDLTTPLSGTVCRP